MCYIYHPLSYYFVTVNGTSSNGLFSLAFNVISTTLSKYLFLFKSQLPIYICLNLNLQLPMQSLSIITDVVSSNLDQGEVYNIM